MENQIRISHIERELIYLDHDFNCRGEFTEKDVNDLVQSIKQHGLLQPIIIRQKKKDKYEYMIVSGHRRFMACSILGWDRVPAYVLKLDNFNAENINAIENLHRLDLNMYQEAKAIEHLLHLPVDTVAEIVNKNIMWVDTRRMLLELPKEIQKLAATGYFNQNNIREIYLRQTDPEAIKKIVSLIKESKNKMDFIDQITRKTPTKKKLLKQDLMKAYDTVKQLHPENQVALSSLLWAANKITTEEFEGVIGCSLSTPKPVDSTDQPS